MNFGRDMSYRDATPGAKIASLPDVFSPAIQISKLFDFQSYFDSTLLETAILQQDQNQPIVPSTLKEVQLTGYAVGLHPSSQTPIALEFKVAGNSGNSNTYVLKPGQVVRPNGRRGSGAGVPGDSGATGSFAGIRYGLPYGWLGGGLATLLIFQTPDAHVDWGTHTELIYHRARYEILQPADLMIGGVEDAPKNWPQRFPWPFAFRGLPNGPVAQQGQPIISIAEPTRALFALRGISDTSALMTGPRVRLIMQASNDVGLNSAGAPILTNPIFDEVTFQLFASLGTSGNLATQNAAVMYDGLMARVAADNGGVVFVDATGSAALNGCFVDAVRYGKL